MKIQRDVGLSKERPLISQGKYRCTAARCEKREPEILANFSYGRAQSFVLCKYISKVCRLLFLGLPARIITWRLAFLGRGVCVGMVYVEEAYKKQWRRVYFEICHLPNKFT